MVRNGPPPVGEISEDEMWIRPDPNQDPARLRFVPGSLVMYLLDGFGWIEGEVLKVCMRLQIPPEFAGTNADQTPPIKYVVWPHSEVPDGEYGSSWIHHDTDEFIRPRLQLSTWDTGAFNPTVVPPKKDPLAHLYTGVSFDPYDEDGKEIAQSFNNIDGVDSATTNADGSITINSRAVGTVQSYTIEIPTEPIFGLDGHSVVKAGQNFSQRRSVSGHDTLDLVELFKSYVPTEASLAQLEAASKTSSDKMLTLGDALMSGVHGWHKDVGRACACYRAAAWGCQEDEEPNRGGVPVGAPEAMVACSQTLFALIRQEFLHVNLWENVATREVLSAALRSERGLSIFHDMLYWLDVAAQRGHVAPLMLEIGRRLLEMEIIQDRRIRNNENILEFCETLIAVWEYHTLEMNFQELQENGLVPRGDPSRDTLDLFAAKSRTIFVDIPISSGTSDTVHIEYRQVPQAPFPYTVFAVVPKRKQPIKLIRLPDYLQVCPFTEESFRFAWQRIAFEVHLGNAVTGERKRPKYFTVLDSHGNRRFADFLRSSISGSGTDVRLVSHSENIRTEGGRRQRQMQLGDILHEIETSLVGTHNYLGIESQTEPNTTLEVDSSISRIATEIFLENDIDQARARSTRIKDQGNRLFGSQDFAGATKCYSVVVEVLRLISDSTDESHLLLGTTLSNRAICFLQMESQRTSVAFQKLLVQNAIRDCTSALKSRWASRVLPQRILDKLKFHLDKAQARLDVLQNDFHSEISSIIFPPPRLQPEQPDEPRREEVGSLTSDGMGNLDGTRRQETGSKATQVSTLDDDLMLETGRVLFDNDLATNSKDGCPVCLRQFGAELGSDYTAVLPCHQHALCVECLCGMKKQSDKAKTDICCPLCRFQVDGKMIQSLAYHIIDKDEALSTLVEKFPAEIEESTEVAIKLLWKWDFRVDKVVDALEKVLDDKVSGVFFRPVGDMDHNQKEQIYQQVRRPVNMLQDKEKRLNEELSTTFETNKCNEIHKKLRTVRSELAAARIKARDEIYERLNTVGNMGAQDTSDSIQVDYHGLHVNEMHSKYEELVTAVLPVVKNITIITGRGLHSTGGSSKLMKALKKKVEKDRSTRWEPVPNNPGALIVRWLGT